MTNTNENTMPGFETFKDWWDVLDHIKQPMELRTSVSPGYSDVEGRTIAKIALTTIPDRTWNENTFPAALK